jgi:hypothetical protein
METRVMMKVMIGWTGGRIQGRQLKVEEGSKVGGGGCLLGGRESKGGLAGNGGAGVWNPKERTNL